MRIKNQNKNTVFLNSSYRRTKRIRLSSSSSSSPLIVYCILLPSFLLLFTHPCYSSAIITHTLTQTIDRNISSLSPTAIDNEQSDQTSIETDSSHTEDEYHPYHHHHHTQNHSSLSISYLSFDFNQTSVELLNSQNSLPPSSSSYHRHVIIIHSIGMILAWFICLPLAIATSSSNNIWPSLIFRLTFLIILCLSLLSGSIYRLSTPELYENQKHSIFGWIVSSVAIILTLFDLSPIWRLIINPYKNSILSRLHINHTDYRLVPPSTDPYHSPSSSSSERPYDHYHQPGHKEQEEEEEEEIKTSISDQGSSVYRERGQTNIINDNDHNIYKQNDKTDQLKRIFKLSKSILDRVLVIVAWAICLSGIVVYTGSCRDSYINGCMAHLIKGSIFFWYGILNWTRYLGGYNEFDWSWIQQQREEERGDHEQGRSQDNSLISSKTFTAEMVESLVVFLYGITNVWMERFGVKSGDPFTVRQIQHISIALMFAFGGLVGILLELPSVRQLLFGRFISKKTCNPFPSICITITGLAMSMHHQEFKFQVSIHTLWGSLLGLFGILRWMTYALMSSDDRIDQAPPVTEALGSVCLIAGGIIFIESTEEISLAAIDHHFDDVMAFLNVTIAFVCLVMVWSLILLFIQRKSAP